jgi:DNA primase small subunit
MEDIVLYYTYPRLDAEVSKHRNHLLKAPFCVHPKTGRVCVPVDPEKVEEFDPETVPTVAQLLRELDSIPTATSSDGSGSEHHSGQ